MNFHCGVIVHNVIIFCIDGEGELVIYITSLVAKSCLGTDELYCNKVVAVEQH